MGGEALLLIVAFAILIVIVAIIADRQARERKRLRLLALTDFARANGFEIAPSGLSSDRTGGFWAQLFQTEKTEEEKFIDAFSQFQPFGSGHSPEVENLMLRRVEGADWYLFDYSYKVTTSNGKTTTTTTYPNGVGAVRLPVLLPTLSLSQETFSKKLGKLFGATDVQFESDEFNRRYVVSCSDRKAAFDLLHPRMIDWLLGMPIMTWQMAGPFLMVYVPEETSAQGFDTILSALEGFVAQLPGYVRQDRGFRPQWTGPLDQMGN